MSNNGKVTFYNDIAFTGLKENNIEVNNTQQLDNNGIYFTSKDKIAAGTPAHITQGSYIYTLGTQASIDGDIKSTYFNKSTSGGYFPTFESVNLSIVSNISTDHFAKTLTYSVTEFKADEFISQYNKLANFANNLANTNIAFSVGEYNLYFNISNEGIVTVGTSSINSDVTFTISESNIDLSKTSAFIITCNTGNNITEIETNASNYLTFIISGSTATVNINSTLWESSEIKDKTLTFEFTIYYAGHTVDGKNYPAGVKTISCIASKANLPYRITSNNHIPTGNVINDILFDFKIDLHQSVKSVCRSVEFNTLYFTDMTGKNLNIGETTISYYLTPTKYENDELGYYVKYNNEFGNQIGYCLPAKCKMAYNITALASNFTAYYNTVVDGTQELVNHPDFRWGIHYENCENTNISNISTNYAYFGTKYTLPNNVTKNDYKFIGWYNNSSYSSKITEVTFGNNGGEVNEENHTHTVYAKWEANVPETSYYWYVGNSEDIVKGDLAAGDIDWTKAQQVTSFDELNYSTSGTKLTMANSGNNSVYILCPKSWSNNWQFWNVNNDIDLTTGFQEVGAILEMTFIKNNVEYDLWWLDGYYGNIAHMRKK